MKANLALDLQDIVKKGKTIKALQNKSELVDIQLISTKNLTSNAKYQRKLDKKKIALLVATFNPHKFGVIKVSCRDGKYYVYDGQHRLFVIKAINNGDDCIVPCEVHYGLTYQDEARLFAEQYDGATKVDVVYQSNALFESDDKDVVKMKAIVEAAGLELPFSKSKQDFKIIAISKLRKMYNELTNDELLQVLLLIKNTWNGISTSLDTEMLGGMLIFYKTYKSEFQEKIFVRNLSKVDPLLIKRMGKADISTKGDLKYAKVIWDHYNTNLNKNRLEYKFKG